MKSGLQVEKTAGGKKKMKKNMMQYRKLWLTALLITLVLIIGSVLVPAQQVFAAGTTYYVAKNGLDSNPGTLAQPWLTIQKAISTMVAGDTTYVRAGTYAEMVTAKRSGKLDNYITLKAYQNENVAIDATGYNYGFQFCEYNYWNIEGFEIYGATWYGARSVNNNHIILKDLYIHDTIGSGIFAQKSSNLIIDGCELYNTNTNGDEEGITLMQVDNFEIMNSYVHDLFPGRIGIDSKNGSFNGTIHNNIVATRGTGIKVDTYADGTDNIQIYSNYVHDCVNGIAVNSEAGQNVEDISVFNNVVKDCSDSAIWLGRFGDTARCPTFTRINIFNNTVFCENTWGYLGVDTNNYGLPQGLLLVDCYVVNNIVDTHLRTKTHNSLYTYGFTGPELTVDRNLVYTNSYERGIAQGTNFILSDPLFTNPGNEDFSLKKGSPAIDAGSLVDAPDTDYAGNTRLEGANIDLGALESSFSNKAPVDHIKIKTAGAKATASQANIEVDSNFSNTTYTAGLSDQIIPVNGKMSYTAEAYDSDDNLISGLEFDWSVNNPEAGLVDSSGLFTAGTEIGSYFDLVQAATSEGITGTASVTVIESPFASIDYQAVDEGQLLQFTVSANANDGLTYSAINLPEGAAFSSSTRVFSWTPSYDQAGSYKDIQFQATDGTYIVTDSPDITVNNVNQAPVLNSISDNTVNTGSALNITVSGSDPDEDSLTYSASNLPAGSSFNASTHKFTWTPIADQVGIYSNIVFQVSDGSLADTENITIMVKSGNNPPVLNSIGDKLVQTGTKLTFTVSGSDADGNKLTYSVSNLPRNATFSASTRKFTWAPAFNQVGTYSNIIFSVSDGTLTDTESISITVKAVNKAPVMSTIASKTVKAGNTLMFTVSATDANGDALTYSAQNLPSGASFDPATRVFSWTPSASQIGRYSNIRFNVTDGIATVYKTATITVSATLTSKKK
jgi:hypothetical protein